MQCIESLLIFAKRPQPHILTKFGIFCRLCVRMLCVGTSPHRFCLMMLFAGGILSKTPVAAATVRTHRVDGRTETQDMAHKSNTRWPTLAVSIYICCCALLCSAVLRCAVRCFALLCLLRWAELCCAFSPPPSPLLFLSACLPSPSPPPSPPLPAPPLHTYSFRVLVCELFPRSRDASLT